jgi:phage tail tape-measure protein
MAQKLNIDIVARDKSKQALNGVQGSLARLKGAVFNLQNAFIGLGAGLVIRNLVNTGKELENLRVRLKFLLKDTNEGAKAFDNMVKFASKVPFSLEEIQSGSGILATVTDNAKDLNKMLEITGNVAAVTGLDFRTTAEQIQRSFSAGIGAADLFREKGVRNMLGFQAGATVSIEATVEAFEKTFGKGGRFGKATDELAETFQGTLSMIGDKVFNFKKVILEAGLFEGLKKEFGALDKFLAENAKQIDAIAQDIGIALAFAVTKVADAVIVLKNNMDKIIVLFKLLIAIKVVKLFLALGGAIQFAAKQMLKFSLASIMTVKGLKGLLVLIAKGGAVYVAFKGIDKLFEESAKSFDGFADGVKNVLPDARDLHKQMQFVKKEGEEVDGFL